MSSYKIRSHEPGFEEDQARIGQEVSKDWAWPFHYTLEELQEIYSERNFDPETQFSCFKGDKMVGFLLVIPRRVGPAMNYVEGMAAYIDPPRVLPGHEEASDLLMKKALTALRTKGVKLAQTRVSTMRPGSIPLMEKWGFTPHKDFPFGYKHYYYYYLDKGPLEGPTSDLLPFDAKRDLEECADGVSFWFKMPKERAKKWILEVDTREDMVSHLVIRKEDELAGYCFAIPHGERKDIIATYYIAAATDDYFTQLITQTVNNAITKNHKYFLVDLMHNLLVFEPVVVALGFEDVATWAIYELHLD